jgi:hypothetical protein
MTKPLFDYDHIEKVMKNAKRDRVLYLRDQAGKAGSALRWGGLGALAAACLALVAGHSTPMSSGTAHTNQSTNA